MYSRIPCPRAARSGKEWRLYIPQMRVWNRVLPRTYAPRLKMEVTWSDRNWLITATELWTRFVVQPNSLEGFWKKILATSNEKVGMYRQKSALEEWIVSGICCWRLRLLRRFSRSDQLLSILFLTRSSSVLFREQLGFILSSTGRQSTRHIEI